MRNIPIESGPGTRVLVRTKRGGCYDNKLGTVVAVLDENLEPGPDPAWYRIKFDIPADNGGTPAETDIFRRRELFPVTYGEDYWGRPSKDAPH